MHRKEKLQAQWIPFQEHQMKKTYPYIISSFLYIYKSIIILDLEFDWCGIGEVWKIYWILDVCSPQKYFLVQQKCSLFLNRFLLAIQACLLYKHEANIRGGGKTVHVVCKYLSGSQLKKRALGAVGVTPLPLITTLYPCWSVDISFKDDITGILLLGVPFMYVY
jgi:hypothetical protein